MKVWITKYALTQGIFEVEAERCVNVDDNMINAGKFGLFHGAGKEWHVNKEDAIKRAEEMRQNKIVNIQKQINKLQNLRFE